MDCKFQITKLPNGQWLHHCTNPGCTLPDIIIHIDSVKRNCNCNSGKKSFIVKASNLVNAFSKWVAAGRPNREKEQIQHIFEEICSKCEEFNKDKKICNICECRCRNADTKFLNKIKMATEHCPLEKW